MIHSTHLVRNCILANNSTVDAVSRKALRVYAYSTGMSRFAFSALRSLTQARLTAYCI